MIATVALLVHPLAGCAVLGAKCSLQSVTKTLNAICTVPLLSCRMRALRGSKRLFHLLLAPHEERSGAGARRRSGVIHARLAGPRLGERRQRVAATRKRSHASDCEESRWETTSSPSCERAQS